jgi:uncharacterized protein YebE (UPF0316 family)
MLAMEILAIKTILYLAIGFLEMFLATQRTYWISQGRSFGAASLVFFENFIALFIIYQLTQNFTSQIPLFVAYAVGNSLGTYLNLEKVPF